MKKLVSVDYMRALSAIYIVAFWHLMEYVKAIPEHFYKNIWTGTITVSILGLFVFISGYLTGGRKGQSLSPLDFYRKRLMRIYPLYALAICLFYLYGINGSQTSLISLFGLSMYWGAKPITLWFITMIVVFYLLAPFFLKLADRPLLYLAAVSGVFTASVGMYVALGTVDIRLLLYLPCFAAGLFCSIHGIVNRVFNPKTMMLLFGMGIPLMQLESGMLAPSRLGRVPLILSLAYLTFYMFCRNENLFKSSRLIEFFSYGSFTMYLFHRPIYSTLTDWYLPEGNWQQLLYMLAIFMVFVTTISWSMQRAYDLMLAATRKPKQSSTGA
ncbi:MAG: acyltransferase [Cyanobacteria bacterium P01_E01_bin.34]